MDKSIIMKNILITGGAGFIGSNLSLSLLRNNYNITVLDNLSSQIHGAEPEKDSPLYRSIKNKVNFIHGDVTNIEDLQLATNDQDIIIHLAAETGTGQSMYQISRYTNVNMVGTSNIFDLISNSPSNTIEKVIVASSRSIYGEGKYNCSKHGTVYPLARRNKDMDRGIFEVRCPYCNEFTSPLPTDENSKLHPSSIYGVTKHFQEELALVAGKSLKIPTIALRFQNVYGPGQSLSNPYTGILSIFSTIINNGNNINVFEDGLESRDFVYIDDVVDAIKLTIDNPIDYGVFNIGTGDSVRVIDVAESLKVLYSSECEINVTGNYRVGDIRHNFADITLAKNTLGFNPKVSFNVGIRNFTDWVKKQEIKSDTFSDSLKIMKSKGLMK